MPTFHDIDILRHNSASWDAQAARDCEWSRPVGAEEVAAARRGDWAVSPGCVEAWGWPATASIRCNWPATRAKTRSRRSLLSISVAPILVSLPKSLARWRPSSISRPLLLNRM
ncbi:hypothetical protein G039_0310755 [Pseudomonas aeruginosa VRFPA01]|nr:hypothetical protein G039_0310755 [Pseudomonas aeruginosa VRFPA01]